MPCRAAGLDTPVVVGGIVPPGDVPVLLDHGVAVVLGPGASNDEVVASVRAAAGVGPSADGGAAARLEPGGQGRLQQGHDLVPVADDPHVAVLEHRRAGVGVDGEIVPPRGPRPCG